MDKRALSLVLGSTTYALSTMLASFMAGLTIGGYLGGLWADRSKQPAFIFGLLEAGIAIFGLITFILIKNLSPVYAWVFYNFHLSFSSFSFTQFFLSFVVMLIPTTLMGATFPLVLKARAKGLIDLGRETGDAYSINNLGAILGSLSAGFILIPIVGITKTNVIAAGLNMIVAIIILLFASSSLLPQGKVEKKEIYPLRYGVQVWHWQEFCYLSSLYISHTLLISITITLRPVFPHIMLFRRSENGKVLSLRRRAFRVLCRYSGM